MTPTKQPHSIRCSDDRWNRAQARTARENTSMTEMITEILDGYAHGVVKLTTAPADAMPKSSGRSIRVTNALWAAAKRKGTTDGMTPNEIIVAIVAAYGAGKINMPRVTKAFAPPASAASAQ